MDIEKIIAEVIKNDLSPSIFNKIDDDDFPLAPNVIDFCIDRDYLGINPYPKQFEILLHFFEDGCPYCSNPKYYTKSCHKESLQELLDNIQLLHHGKCPKCKKTRIDFYNDKKLKFKNSNHLTTYPYELDIAAGQRTGKCISPESLVFTKNGLTKIEELDQGKFGTIPYDSEVYSDKGWEQTTHFIKNKIEKIERIKTKRGMDLGASLIHPVLVLTEEGKKVWRKNKNIDVGTIIPIHINTQIWGENTNINFSYKHHAIDNEGNPITKEGEVLSSSARISHQKLAAMFPSLTYEEYFRVHGYIDCPPKIPKKVTTTLASFLGWLTAEGNINLYGVRFSNQSSWVNTRYIKYIKKLFGLVVTQGYRNNKEIGVEFGNRCIGNFLAYLGCKGSSATVEIPWIIRQAPKKYMISFLRALYEGDGSLNGPRIDYTTISYNLAQQVRVVLLNLGIPCFIENKMSWATNGTENQVSKPVYTVFVYGKYLEVFQKEINFLSKRKKNKLQELINFYNSRTNKVPFFYEKLPDSLKPWLHDNFRHIDELIRKEKIKYLGYREYTIVSYFLSGDQKEQGEKGRDLYKKLTRGIYTDNICIKKASLLRVKNGLISAGIEKIADKKIKKFFKRLDYILQDDIFLDEVIEKTKDKSITYDFHIPKTHRFITNGCVSHNSALTSMASAYVLHRYMKLPSPAQHFDLLEGSTLYGTFTALTFEQARETLFEPFKERIDNSKWFNGYFDMLNHYQQTLPGVEDDLYRSKDTYLHIATKALTIYPKGPHRGKLRGQ